MDKFKATCLRNDEPKLSKKWSTGTDRKYHQYTLELPGVLRGHWFGIFWGTICAVFVLMRIVQKRLRAFSLWLILLSFCRS